MWRTSRPRPMATACEYGNKCVKLGVKIGHNSRFINHYRSKDEYSGLRRYLWETVCSSGVWLYCKEILEKRNVTNWAFNFPKYLTLFCIMTNKCTIISQIITLHLHISTLLCHRQGACNQYLSKLHKYGNSSW